MNGDFLQFGAFFLPFRALNRGTSRGRKWEQREACQEIKSPSYRAICRSRGEITAQVRTCWTHTCAAKSWQLDRVLPEPTQPVRRPGRMLCTAPDAPRTRGLPPIEETNNTTHRRTDRATSRWLMPGQLLTSMFPVYFSKGSLREMRPWRCLEDQDLGHPESTHTHTPLHNVPGHGGEGQHGHDGHAFFRVLERSNVHASTKFAPRHLASTFHSPFNLLRGPKKYVCRPHYVLTHFQYCTRVAWALFTS